VVVVVVVEVVDVVIVVVVLVVGLRNEKGQGIVGTDQSVAVAEVLGPDICRLVFNAAPVTPAKTTRPTPARQATRRTLGKPPGSKCSTWPSSAEAFGSVLPSSSRHARTKR
jgi:hypothetical protein